MNLAEAYEIQAAEHPIDAMESLAADREWPSERGTEDDMNICVSGRYCDFHIAISWRPDLGGLHLASVLDIKVPENKMSDICQLLALINEQLWLGHFDVWSADGAVLFRNTLMVSGEGLNEAQCEDLLNHAVGSCEKFFPAFQYLIWAGHAPQEALEACMFETKGDA
jgi:hypothetical protein